MPYIEVKVSEAITPEKEVILKEKMGIAIENFPGKTERWLMVNFEQNCHLWFMGDNEKPTAYVEVKLFGDVLADAAENMTKDICSCMEEVLGIPQDRTYVKYEAVYNWGWNGTNF